MNKELAILAATAASIGFFHTLLGPDHYVPFAAMAKARRWTLGRTVWITVLCGLGHVGSSVILGLVGVALGLAVTSMKIIESVRGEWAAWALIIFGLVYFIYGVRRIFKHQPHVHEHAHGDGLVHSHRHEHQHEHAHIHGNRALSKTIPWALFVVFVLGPCEPLIPLLMYPAVRHNMTGVFLVTAVFSLVTIVTMVSAVVVSAFGMNFLFANRLGRFSHALAGFAIMMCGCAIQFLGL